MNFKLVLLYSHHPSRYPNFLLFLSYSEWDTIYDPANPVCYNFEARPPGHSQSTSDLHNNVNYFSNDENYKEFGKEEYCEMVSEQEAQYSFGRHSLTEKFKPNLPFVLYWTYGSKALRYDDIKEIDLINRDEFLETEISECKSIYDPVVLYFGEKTELNISKSVDTHTEYTLFTYLNNTRYYLARNSKRKITDDVSERYMLTLTSVKNKDTMKVQIAKKNELPNPYKVSRDKHYILCVGPKYYLKNELCFVRRQNDDGLTKFVLTHKSLQVAAFDHFHLIPPHNFITHIKFYKQHSKICFCMKEGKFVDCIYFCKDDQNLKLGRTNKRYYFDIELESDSYELLESTQFKIVVDRDANKYLKLCMDGLKPELRACVYNEHRSQDYLFSLHALRQYYTSNEIDRIGKMMNAAFDDSFDELAQSWEVYRKNKDNNISKIRSRNLAEWRFQARFDKSLSNAYQLLHQYIEEYCMNNQIYDIIYRLSTKVVKEANLKLNFWYFFLSTNAINYYSDQSLSTFVNIFLNRGTKPFWYQNDNITVFYQSMVDKHLKLKVMPKNACLGKVNAKILVEQFLESSKYTKRIISGWTVDSTFSSSIFKQFSELYFFPVDVPALVIAYSQAYKIKFDEIKAQENEIIQRSNKPIPFLSTDAQQAIRNIIDSDGILLDQGTEYEFKLGYMIAEAVICSTLDKDIIKKIQQKYDLNSLIRVLDMNDESFHLLEVVVCLLRSCYLNPNDQLQTVNESLISQIKQSIYKQLEKIVDISNISQIRFATECITLLTNCNYKMGKGNKLITLIGSLLSSVLKDFDVYTIPNAIDFASADTQIYFSYGFILDHNIIVDNECYERNVILETNQKDLISAILCLIMKFGFKKLSLNKTELNSELFTCLNINERMIEKCIVLLILILKYVDIPFDEEFTDQLFDTLLHLQSKPKDSLLIETKYNPTDKMVMQLWSKNNDQNRETDREFIDFSRIVQNAIVSIHNCEIIRSTQGLQEIDQLIQKMTEIQEDIQYSGEQNIDSRFAIILAELLYKIRCNSTFIEVRRNGLINELVVKVYKFLGHFMYNNQQICVRLWYFSHKLFCMKWWNDKLNRYHAEFFLLCVEGLGKYKTTLYTKELFSKVIKSIGEILIKELQKEVSRHKDDESLKELLTLISQIGEKHENNTIKEDREESKEKRNENNDNQSKEDSKENDEEKEKESEKEENEEESEHEYEEEIVKKKMEK